MHLCYCRARLDEWRRSLLNVIGFSIGCRVSKPIQPDANAAPPDKKRRTLR